MGVGGGGGRGGGGVAYIYADSVVCSCCSIGSLHGKVSPSCE